MSLSNGNKFSLERSVVEFLLVSDTELRNEFSDGRWCLSLSNGCNFLILQLFLGGL